MGSSPRSVLTAIALIALVALGSGDRVYFDPTRPDDPALVGGSQWNLTAIGAAEAWRSGTGLGATIAVVDSGIDRSHPDLAAQVAETVDCVGAAGRADGCRSGGRDDAGHGTHVAGIAAATTDNGEGVAGVAPDARLLAVRVLTEACTGPDCVASGSTLDVVAGIRWATANGADVINLSLGTADGSLRSRPVAAAVEEAWAAGVVVVAAAGNRTVTAGFAELPMVVVTAVDRELTLADYASGVADARWGLAAPGGEVDLDPGHCSDTGDPAGVLSTSYDPSSGSDGYACLSGTSMAAPHVSGAVAVLLSLGYSPADAVERLLETARDLGAPGPDTIYGAGLLALDRAVLPGPPVAGWPDPASAELAGGTALAASGSPTIAGTVAPRPTRPPLLPTMLAGSALSLSGAGAIMLGRRLWRERNEAA